MFIDPRIRVLSLVMFGAAVATGGRAVVLLGAGLVGFAYVVVDNVHALAAWRMVKRMRWIFLSIVVFYFWFTPGHPLTSLDASWLPTVEGVQSGLLRVLALVTLVMVVNLVLQTTARESLLMALLWCLRPLRWLGLPHERFAVRMMLVLNAVPRVQTLYPGGANPGSSVRARAGALGAGISEWFVHVIDAADREPTEPVEVAGGAALEWTQWLVPVVLAMFLVVAHTLDRAG